jgi:beta-lactamase regulating signal transducer with metallopeptidase domain
LFLWAVGAVLLAVARLMEFLVVAVRAVRAAEPWAGLEQQVKD